MDVSATTATTTAEIKTSHLISTNMKNTGAELYAALETLVYNHNFLMFTYIFAYICLSFSQRNDLG